MFKKFLCKVSDEPVNHIPGQDLLELISEHIQCFRDWRTQPRLFPTAPPHYACEPHPYEKGHLIKTVGLNGETYSYDFIRPGRYIMITCDYINMVVDDRFVRVWSKEIGPAFGLTFHPDLEYKGEFVTMTVDAHGQPTYTSERVGDEFRSDARVAHDAALAAGAY